MHPHHTPNGSTPSLPGWSRTAIALIALAGGDPIDLYLRVSGGRQEKEQTIDTQDDVLTSGIELCGGRVGEKFKDDPFTGTVRDRPGLNKAMAAYRISHKAGRRRYLLMYDTGRLARGEPWLRPMIEDELRQLGAQFAYVLSETDDSDEGMVMDGLRSLFDSWERKKIVRRLADGRDTKIKRGGLWRGPRPYGWLYRTVAEMRVIHNDPHRKDGELVHHPDEASIVKEIITSIATGKMTAHSMAGDLNRRGLRTTEGNEWRPNAVRLVVTNPLNSARAVERRYETTVPRHRRKTMEERKSKTLKSSRRNIDSSAWVILEHQPAAGEIVSPDLQDAAIAAMRRNSKLRNATRPTNRFFVLRGLVYCMAPRVDRPELHCGCRMHGAAPPDRRALYRCTQLYPATATRPSARCKTHINAHILETLVWNHVKNIIEHEDLLLDEMRIAQQSDADAITATEVALAAARAALEAATKAVDGVVRLYRLGKLAEEDYDRHYAEACGERENSRARVAEAERMRADVDRAAQRWAGLKSFFRDLKGQLADAEAPGEPGARKRAELIRWLADRVEIYPDGRKFLRGRLPCVTGDLSDRVATDSTSCS